MYNNRPVGYTETKEVHKHVGGEYWTEPQTTTYPKGYNCVGWAMMILESAGIPPPVPSNTPNIFPMSRK